MLVYEIFTVGLLLLVLGAETLLRGAIGLSRVVRIPPLVVGAVVVAIGAAAPELAVALQAVSQGTPDIAVGSIVGGCILNLLLVLGVAALLRPLPSAPKVVFRDGGGLLLASLALVVIAQVGTANRAAGIALLCGFVLYLALSFVTDWRRPVPLSLAESRALTRNRAPRADAGLVLFVFGLLCLIFGARFVVESAVAIARVNKASQAMVGLTIVASCAALPGFFTAVVASALGQTKTIAGQVLGASVLNLSLVLGLAAFMRPLAVPGTIAGADAYVLAASSGVVVAMMLPGWRLARGQAFFLLLCFAAYVVFLAWRQGMLGLH